MSSQTTHNNPKVGAFFELVAPRDLGRGASLKSDGGIGVVSWDGNNVLDDGVIVFELLQSPSFLDIAYDRLDRPQISYTLSTGESFIYFYNGLLADYELLSIGFQCFEPALCGDYLLDGVNTVLVYLKSGVPTYRLQADRFAIEYTLVNRKARGIKAFGYGVGTNSIQLIVGLWR